MVVDVVQLQVDVDAPDYLHNVFRSPLVGASNVLPGAESLIVEEVASETGYGHDSDLRRLLHSSLSMIAPVMAPETSPSGWCMPVVT